MIGSTVKIAGPGVDDTPVDGNVGTAVSSNWANDHAADLDAHISGGTSGQLLVVTGAATAALQNTGVKLTAPDIQGIVTAAAALTMPAHEVTGTLQCAQVNASSGYYANAGSAFLRAIAVDDGVFLFQARDNGVGNAEVARLQGAADPYFQATKPLRLSPIATASLPGTPVEGMIAYDNTLNKLVMYNGTAWETITSAVP